MAIWFVLVLVVAIVDAAVAMSAMPLQRSAAFIGLMAAAVAPWSTEGAILRDQQLPKKAEFCREYQIHGWQFDRQ